MKKLAIICNHFATGGMPQIVSTELAHRKDYEISLFVLNDFGCDVQLNQVKAMPHVQVVFCKRNEVISWVKEMGVGFVVCHDTACLNREFRNHKIKVITVVHSTILQEPDLFHSQSDLYLAVSSLVASQIRTKIPNANVQVIRTPVDTDRFTIPTIDRKNDWLHNDFLICHSGVWCENKNQKGMLTIYARFLREAKNAKLMLVGGMYDNFKEYWEPITENLHKEGWAMPDGDKIYIVGETDKPEYFYGLADVFVNTSHAEGCSLAIREAAATGLPCIISECEGNRASFKDSPFAFASTDNDGQSYVEALRYLYKNRTERLELGKAGRQWVIDSFGIEQYISQMTGIYDTINTSKSKPERKRIHFIKFESSALGDTLAWLPAAIAFAKKHSGRVRIWTFWNDFLSKHIKSDDFEFVSQDYHDYDELHQIGIYDQNQFWRTKPLMEVSCDILGVSPIECVPLRFNINANRQKSVCISEHATTQAKRWQNQTGWQEIVDWLVQRRYEVYAISKEPTTLKNVIDDTGDKPIGQRAQRMAECEFFIGLSSGLAWLANVVNTHVFMIHGGTYDWHEFQDNVTHVGRLDVCRGCWNRLEYPLDKSVDWCPSGLGFQCSKYITAEMVISIIQEWGENHGRHTSL